MVVAVVVDLEVRASWLGFGDGLGQKGCFSLSPPEVTYSLIEGSLSSNVGLDPHR